MDKTEFVPLNIVHTEASLGWGGQEIRILTEAEGMRARGHIVRILCPENATIFNEAIKREIPVTPLPIGRKNLVGLKAIYRWLRKNKVDVINTHSSTDSWLVALVSLFLKEAPPMVRTRHISAPVPKNLPTRWLYTRATRHIVTTGECLRETLIRDNHCRKSRVTSIPTGVDAARFRPGDKIEARRALGLDPSARYIGIVATLRSWKGHLYLIDAFAQLFADDTNIELLIVGDGPMREVIEERVAQLGLSSKVILAGRQDAIELWLQALDVFCLPSYANEGVPQAMLQAMLTELPIVSTPVGSIPEAVTDGVSGLLVAPKDVEALTKAIRRLLTDQAVTGRLGAAARETAVRHFGLDTMVFRMEAVFRNTIDSYRNRRKGFRARWQRLQRSLRRRWREWRLPRGYMRLGTKYGGWWIDRRAIRLQPLLIDCGLGCDISFPVAFLSRFGGIVIGIEPNPQSLSYCRDHCPPGMHIVDKAFWTKAGQTLTFYLPRAQEQLPRGADGVSGSLVNSHEYVGGSNILTVTTTSLEDVLSRTGRTDCDVLKLDIEGAEYQVLEDLCTRGLLSKVRQLLVEFHHRATHHTMAETQAITARIENAGFHLVHVEGRNYIFRRRDID